MSKKKLFILPVIVLVIVSIMSISVLGASPSAGFKVYKNNGSGDANDITSEFKGEKISAMNLNDISGLQDLINKVDKKLKVKDFVCKASYEIRNTGSDAGKPWRIVFTDYKVSSSYVAITVHKTGASSYDVKVFKGNGGYAAISDVTSTSPFYLYVAKVNSSAQTGDFVPAYVAMIAVALMSCGAIFAIRAKKASK